MQCGGGQSLEKFAEQQLRKPIKEQQPLFSQIDPEAWFAAYKNGLAFSRKQFGLARVVKIDDFYSEGVLGADRLGGRYEYTVEIKEEKRGEVFIYTKKMNARDLAWLLTGPRT